MPRPPDDRKLSRPHLGTPVARRLAARGGALAALATLAMATLAVATLALAMAAPAAATARALHHDTESFAHLRLLGERAELVLELDSDALLGSVEALPPLTEDWEAPDVAAALPRIEAWLDERFELRIAGERVAVVPSDFTLLRAFDPLLKAERNLRVALRCPLELPPGDAAASLRQELFVGRELDHRHTLLLEAGGLTLREWRVRSGEPFHFELPDLAPGATGRAAHRAALQAAQQMASAPWLAAFLLALLLAPLSIGARARSLGAALTATAAGCLASRLDWIAPSPWAAQAAAALAIAYVAGENLLARDLKLRSATAALFGLVHGMALAAPSLAAQPAFDPAPSELPGAANGAVVVAAWLASALLSASAIGGVAALLLLPLAKRAPLVARIGAVLLMALGAAGLFLAVRARPGG
ncbi:MAG: hypothetical protein JNL90_02355 [Planctomycetes bacterium]|nr:hypothetical protein [Planctomycetota bacterium]